VGRVPTGSTRVGQSMAKDEVVMALMSSFSMADRLSDPVRVIISEREA
jgi:hypothetical protein